MRFIISISILGIIFPLYAQDDALTQDPINRPALSLRCQELFRERDSKIRVQQKLNALLQRSQDLLIKNSKANSSVQSRIQSSQVKIKNEIHMTNQQIEQMEENIVRSGCPGLSL